jgi:integrase
MNPLRSHHPAIGSIEMRLAIVGRCARGVLIQLLEEMTLKGYEEHVLLHINPFIGAKKLSDLTAPVVSAFADRLREQGRSAEMIRRAIRSLGSIFKEARRRGLASHFPIDDLDLDLPERDDPRVVAPTKAELQAIIAGAAGRWRPLILVAIFCGLRASELRGLRWEDVNFEDREITIKQRADARNRIGKLKSKAAYRSVPMPSMVANTLREWRLVCPKGELRPCPPFRRGQGRIALQRRPARLGTHSPQGWHRGVGGWLGRRRQAREDRKAQVRPALPAPWLRQPMDRKRHERQAYPNADGAFQHSTHIRPIRPLVCR